MKYLREIERSFVLKNYTISTRPEHTTSTTVEIHGPQRYFDISLVAMRQEKDILSRIQCAGFQLLPLIKALVSRPEMFSTKTLPVVGGFWDSFDNFEAQGWSYDKDWVLFWRLGMYLGYFPL